MLVVNIPKLNRFYTVFIQYLQRVNNRVTKNIDSSFNSGSYIRKLEKYKASPKSTK
jgi:hypothetical protein